jgi:ABC-2 type transport system permease protein
MTGPPRARRGVALAWRQVGYQLLLLSRSPLGTFTVLVVPLMLLGALALVNPEDSLQAQGYARYADFLAPAMATFALLNGCYINVATSVVTSREAGVLKRLHTSPLPLWAYVLGRLGAAAVVGGGAFWAVLLTGVLLFGVPLGAAQVGYLAVIVALGVVTFSLLGVALSTVVHSTDSALPFAYGTFLPIAFISDIFFPIGAAPAALRRVAEAFPVAAISQPAERVFREDGWPMTGTELLVLLGWTVLAAVVTVTSFSWEPGGLLRSRGGRRKKAPA